MYTKYIMNLLNALRRWRYEIIAFTTGASVMILEIVGARLIAPFFGTSTYVWTAMIGVILGALAVGYAVGGKLADRDSPSGILAVILLISAVFVLVIGLTQHTVLPLIAAMGLDLRLGAFLSALILFAPPSLLVGMVSPHLAKIRIDSLATSGQSVGRLEAAGALGSIAGTFSCGYFLLGLFGSRLLVLGVVVLLVLTSLLAAPRGFAKLRLGVMAMVVLMGLITSVNPPNVLADVDTPYSRFQVSKATYAGASAHFLTNDDSGIQSAVDLDNPYVPLFSYAQRFQETAALHPNLKDVLVIGGGAFTFPSILVETYPEVTVDAVEIDPRLESIAKDYFFLSDSDRLHIHTEDGRTFLNRTDKKYDAIYIDAYSSLSPPFQLTTQQAVGHMKRALKPDGVVIVNAIDRPSHPDFLAPLLATYGSVFDYTLVRPSNIGGGVGTSRENFILYAGNHRETFDQVSRSLIPPFPVPGGGKILTDDYAPIERLTN